MNGLQELEKKAARGGAVSEAEIPPPISTGRRYFVLRMAGVYILTFISILVFIKTAIFSRFYKKLGPFLKNSDVISLVIYQSQPKLH